MNRTSVWPEIMLDGQLFVMRLADHLEQRITDLKAGWAAVWPHWRPGGTPPS
ncbi:MAG: hypothetical protein KA354_21600 [Phycisphaerae bacterium]|nr:hypothetical protein [Phycisphaerae bacterium]